MTDQITTIHLYWCEITGQDVRDLPIQFSERHWYEFLKLGCTKEDLKLVVDWMLMQNKSGRVVYQLLPSKVVGDLERFCEIRAELRAKQRNRRPAPTPKEQILQSFRPEIEQMGKGNVRTIGDVFKTIKTN